MYMLRGAVTFFPNILKRDPLLKLKVFNGIQLYVTLAFGTRSQCNSTLLLPSTKCRNFTSVTKLVFTFSYLETLRLEFRLLIKFYYIF